MCGQLAPKVAVCKTLLERHSQYNGGRDCCVDDFEAKSRQ